MTDMERIDVSRSLLQALRPAWVQRTFRISHTSLSSWVRNGIPPARLPGVLEEVRSLVDGEHKEAPRPEWAEGLATKGDLEAMEARLLGLLSRDPALLNDVRAEARADVEQLQQAPGGEQSAEPRDKSE